MGAKEVIEATSKYVKDSEEIINSDYYNTKYMRHELKDIGSMCMAIMLYMKDNIKIEGNDNFNYDLVTAGGCIWSSVSGVYPGFRKRTDSAIVKEAKKFGLYTIAYMDVFLNAGDITEDQYDNAYNLASFLVDLSDAWLENNKIAKKNKKNNEANSEIG